VPELAHLPLTLVALAPFADVAAKPLDLDQQIIVAALAPRVRGRIAIATAKIAEIVAKPRDLAGQRIDGLLHLRKRCVGTAALRSTARGGRIVAVPARLLSGGTWGHGRLRPACRYRGGSM
jgi:hypothetical protein